jgi:hypothetical protein
MECAKGGMKEGKHDNPDPRPAKTNHNKNKVGMEREYMGELRNRSSLPHIVASYYWEDKS